MPDSGDVVFERLLSELAATPDVTGHRRPIVPGRRLADRFEIERRIGAGGMGQVFLAWDHLRGTPVAAKLLGAMTPQSIGLIKKEFRAASELVHPNLVRLHELFADDGEWFFTMDFVDGVTLPSLLEKARPTPNAPDLLVGVFRQLAVGLTALHRAGLLHRDLKPLNFLITEPDHQVILLDFGLARPVGSDHSRDRAGTPAYMSPEHFRGEPLTEASDWYAFGVILCEALTGSLPAEPVDLSVFPSIPSELATLCRRLLAPEPQDRPSSEEVLAVLGLSPAQPLRAGLRSRRQLLVGRARELDVLETALDRTSAGQPSVVLLHGPSGIGKTALVEHFVDRARSHGAFVLRGRCREHESMSYKAVDGLIDGIIEVLESLPEEEALALLPPDIARLTVLFPALRAAGVVARKARKRFDTPDRATLRRQAIAAFGAMLAEIRERHPLVIWIDDLQWSDRESALLLGPVLGGPTPTPLLFVGSYRSDAAARGPLLDELFADGSLNLPAPIALALGPLSPKDAMRLAFKLLPSGEGDRLNAARKIARDTTGNPLFIAELAQSGDGIGAPEGPNATASSLVELIANRVDALPEEARAFLQMTAVSGTPLPRNILWETQGLASAEAEKIVDLLRANRLAHTRGLGDQDTVEIFHDRIREIIIEGLSGERRRGCHLAIARSLEARPDSKPEVVAIEFEGAGELARAGPYWIAAADHALRTLAFGHAADLYRQGLAQASLPPEERRQISIRCAEALAYAGKGTEAAALYLTMTNEGSTSDVECQRRAAEQLLLSGHLDQGLGVVRDVLAAMGMGKPLVGRRALLSVITRRLLIRARGLRHVERAESELPRADLARLDTSWTIACALGAVDFMRGAEFQNRHLLLALRAGEPRRLLRALTLEVAYAATPGPGSARRTAHLLAVADAIAQRTKDESAQSLLCLTRGLAAYLQGHIVEALADFERALDLLSHRSVGAVWEMVTARRFVVASLFFLGRFRKLSEYVPPLLAEAEANGNLYATMCFRSGYSTLSWLAADAVTQARSQLERARREWNATGFQLAHFNFLLGEIFVDLYVGDVESALARLRSSWRSLFKAQLHRISIVRVQIWHLRAACSMLVADELDARQQWAEGSKLRAGARRAIARLRADPVLRAGPLASYLEAGLLLAAGNRGRARWHLSQCMREFDAHGFKLFSAAVRVRLGELEGGGNGARLVEDGYGELRAEGVAAPDRMLGLLVPGLKKPT